MGKCSTKSLITARPKKAKQLLSIPPQENFIPPHATQVISFVVKGASPEKVRELNAIEADMFTTKVLASLGSAAGVQIAGSVGRKAFLVIS